MTERLQPQPEDFAEVPDLTTEEPEREGRLMRAARWIAKGFEPIEGEHCIGVSAMGFVAIIPKEAPTGPGILPAVYERPTTQPEVPKGRPPVPTNQEKDPLSPDDDDDEEGDTSWGKLYRLGKKKNRR